jgi:DNA phosphorothioation-associated putative methyltransferase
MQILRHKTAITRRSLSRPLTLAIEAGLIDDNVQVFDYGCGKGGDLSILRNSGIACSGWDPAHFPQGDCVEADVVNLGYVVNVIEDPIERADALSRAWSLARRVLVVSARLEVEAKQACNREFADGCVTRRDTFQKFFAQHELREWINSTLSVESVAAAPGIFFVFRDEQLRQTFASARYRRHSTAPRQRLSDALFQEHREVLQELMEFFASRGRLPDRSEADLSQIETVFGSIRRAFSLVQRVTGSDQWDRIRDDRRQDLLVYLALATFDKRPRASALPLAIQLDIKGFFGSYARACEHADELLFSAGNVSAIDQACMAAPFGKLTVDALYIHATGIPALPSILRVYEGCARNYVGIVDGANIVKLHRQKPKVSYLAYPEFDADPHPTLIGALVVPLTNFDVKYWNYDGSPNPPILHRKETFVPADYPGRGKFERLSKQEERCGLLDDTMRIGHREQWKYALEEKGVVLRGHRLTRRQPTIEK